MRVIALAACLLLFTASGAASADAPPASDHDKAVAAFEEGRRLLETGHCDTGILKLQESLRYEPSIGARVSLADCLEATEPLAAWIQLKEAVRLAYLNHDDRLAVVDKRATALEPRLSLLHLVVRQRDLAERGFELRLDGEIMDPFFYKDGLVATSPGDHAIVASTPERQWSSSVVTANGTTKTMTVELTDRCAGDRAAPAPARVAPVVLARTPAQGAGARRTVADILAGAAVAGVGAGVGFGVLALQKRSDLSTACGGDTTRCNAPPGSLDVARESAQNVATVSIMGFVFGGAALVGATTLYLVGVGVGPKAATLGVSPVFGTNGGGLGVTGTW
jgi:hypothetical protein